VAGRLHYYLAAGKRRAYLNNTSQIFDFTRDLKPWHSFQSHARNVLELLKTVSEPADSLPVQIELVGASHLEAARRSGRGMILTTLHSGNWELSGLYLAASGYPITTVAGQQLRAGWSDQIKDFKERYGIRTVSPEDSPRTIVRDLAGNRITVLHLDGDVFAGGVDTSLLGHAVKVPRGPAALARISGAPVAFAYCRRLPSGALRIVIEEPLSMPEGANREAELTHRLVRRMEKCILDAPGQWCIFRELAR
jgi:KDO2-lipid IV(A) lauroyltransferase